MGDPSKRVTGVLTIEHHRTNAKPLARNLSHVSRLFPQLPQCAYLWTLPLIDEAGWHLDGDLVDRGSKLLLQEKFGTGRFLEDGYDADAVDEGVLRAGLALRRLPSPLFPVRISVGGSEVGESQSQGLRGKCARV